MKPQVDSRLFGELANGEPVMEFTLDNGQGMLLSVLDYGCIIRSWRALGRHGAPVDFVLGFDTLLDYERDTARFGALVGRRGLHKRCWQGRASSDNEVARLTLWRLSRDGDEGYPGNLLLMVAYELSVAGEMRCCYQALCDQPTPVAISQHNYFNLAGEGTTLGHELCIDAAHYLRLRPDPSLAGELRDVAGGPFDFRLKRSVGEGLAQPDPQLDLAGGYDHDFVLAGGAGPKVCLADPGSGRQMDIYTDCPGLHLYSGNRLDGTLAGKGRDFISHAGLCLMPLHFTDTICHPGAPYSAGTRYVMDRWR
ncbi:aldose epimerase family protein [Duganella sp. Root336D2]|uniref:aldose epimerase family protein n=1 Tax=Duganella sp. Root336D2 TaxID=1736518 RepID=UPI0006F79FC3|nr:aldose epimerase family protein [Duganella sp. Root336D2]KQV61349.1 hypothetical protein ASD07_00315 [Duganella sp. Root336D2]